MLSLLVYLLFGMKHVYRFVSEISKCFKITSTAIESDSKDCHPEITKAARQDAFSQRIIDALPLLVSAAPDDGFVDRAKFFVLVVLNSVGQCAAVLRLQVCDLIVQNF